jgi:tetratricopeptide (TPR) repeat protein
MSSFHAPVLALSLALAAPAAAAGLPSKTLKSAPQRSALQRPEDLLPASSDLLAGKALTVLKRLIASSPDGDPSKPDLLLRLANHARARSYGAGSAARALNETAAAAGLIRRRALLREQRRRRAEARSWQKTAIRIYRKIATEQRYAKYARNDEALFNAAALLLRAGKLKQGKTLFVRLIRDHPQSKHIPATYIAFADSYYDQGKMPQAMRLYQQVTKYPGARLYGYAIYKLGWCWINLSDHRKALEAFVRIIRSAPRWTNVPAAARDRLVHEARKDAVLAYASVGRPAKAHPFFQRIGGQQAQEMLERLARVYADQGKFRESTSIYRRLIALAPSSDALCDWQLGIVHATMASQGRQTQVIEARRLTAVYRALRRRTGASTEAVKQCRTKALKTLQELSAALHAETAKGAPVLRTLAGYVDKELDALRKP